MGYDFEKSQRRHGGGNRDPDFVSGDHHGEEAKFYSRTPKAVFYMVALHFASIYDTDEENLEHGLEMVKAMAAKIKEKRKESHHEA